MGVREKKNKRGASLDGARAHSDNIGKERGTSCPYRVERSIQFTPRGASRDERQVNHEVNQ